MFEPRIIYMFKITRIALFVLPVILIGNVLLHGQTPTPSPVPDNAKIPWTMTVVVMDGADPIEQAEIPVKAAVKLIEAHSRFAITVRYVRVPVTVHGYTPYRIGPDKNHDGKPDFTVYAMMGWNVPKLVIDSLPVSTSYLFLYKLYGRKPAQAGSALGLDFGLIMGGKPRPYATVPVDEWWYVNNPPHGVESSASQVLIHEINNTIQAKLEARPYRCKPLTATQGQKSAKFEAERLSKITEPCYAKLGNNAN